VKGCKGHGGRAVYILYCGTEQGQIISYTDISLLFSSNDSTAPWGPRPPHYRGFTITLRHTKLGRTPLCEWPALHRDLYLTTHNTQKRQTSIRSAGFEPTIPVSERPQNISPYLQQMSPQCPLNRRIGGPQGRVCLDTVGPTIVPVPDRDRNQCVQLISCLLDRIGLSKTIVVVVFKLDIPYCWLNMWRTNKDIMGLSVIVTCVNV
jgi:hypothetical protein